jgi:hypothetical protein
MKAYSPLSFSYPRPHFAKHGFNISFLINPPPAAQTSKKIAPRILRKAQNRKNLDILSEGASAPSFRIC